jgi:outer membrane lipoprotein LolB
MGTVLIEGDGNVISLTDKDGVETVLQDPELELRRRYGWTIPIASLRYWALGIPDPGEPASTEFDEDGLLSRLEQRGWVVEISRYREGGGQQMPRILSATNPATRVRMVIDRWLFFDR